MYYVRYAWPLTFGKPDGWLIRLRCAVLLHAWRICDGECCESQKAWCRRCNTFRDVPKTSPVWIEDAPPRGNDAIGI